MQRGKFAKVLSAQGQQAKRWEALQVHASMVIRDGCRRLPGQRRNRLRQFKTLPRRQMNRMDNREQAEFERKQRRQA